MVHSLGALSGRHAKSAQRDLFGRVLFGHVQLVVDWRTGAREQSDNS
jgi:hypothetical protein